MAVNSPRRKTDRRPKVPDVASDKRLIIVSGLSGSGKSVALHVLEDLGYYCIDNLPAALLQSAVAEVSNSSEQKSALLAVGIDARNRQQDLKALPTIINSVSRPGHRHRCVVPDGRRRNPA